jgi:hypothetical protein
MVTGADGIPNLEANQHGMCLIDQSNHDGTLFHCLLRIFYLEYPALRREGDRIVVVIVPEHRGCFGTAELSSAGSFKQALVVKELKDTKGL